MGRGPFLYSDRGAPSGDPQRREGPWGPYVYEIEGQKPSHRGLQQAVCRYKYVDSDYIYIVYYYILYTTCIAPFFALSSVSKDDLEGGRSPRCPRDRRFVEKRMADRTCINMYINKYIFTY